MTTDQLQTYLAAAKAAKTRADKATPGPWYHYEGDIFTDPIEYGTGPVIGNFCYERIRHGKPKQTYCPQDVSDSQFVARARTDIPALADAVAELVAEVERLTDDNKQLQENYEMSKRIIHSAGGISRECLP